MRGTGRVRLSLFLAAAGLTATVLAGCATPAATSTPAASTAVPLTSVSTPAGGAPAQAVALARQLLAQLALPPGARAIKLSSVPPPARPPWSTAAGSVDAGRLIAARQTMADVRAFLLRHGSDGASVTATGHENGPVGLIAQYLYFDLTPPPSGIDEEDLSIGIMPRPAGGTLIAVYDRVTWFPARTATEHVTAADFRSVTVSALMLNPRPHRLTRTVSSAAVITSLASLLNGLPAAPDTEMSCPAMLESYQLTFNPVNKQAPPVVVSTGMCDIVQIAIRAISQPALADQPGAITAQARQLLHLPPEAG